MGLTIVGVHVDGLAETQAQPVQFWTQDFDSNVTSCSTGMKTKKKINKCISIHQGINSVMTGGHKVRLH